jgi:hypothetical protein
VFTKDDICTLVNVVIVDPTQMDLLPQSCATQGFATSNAIQAKEQSYHDRHPVDQFLPLREEIFGCLCKQTNVFLHNCANAIWGLKTSKDLSLFVFVTFLQQKNSIHITKLQASSILSQVVAVATSQLPSPISMNNLLQVAGF